MKKIVYQMVNAFVLLAVLVYFYLEYQQALVEFFGIKIVYLLSLAIVVILVNGLKAFRLFFILSSNKITAREYIKQYCKTVPVSMLVPLKLGDVFKVYCYGYQLKNYFAGMVYVLIDRFFDTLALLTLIIIVTFITRVPFLFVIYLLLFFVFCVIAAYVLVPSICRYWKKHLLHAPGTSRSLRLLSLISKVERITGSIYEVMKGKGAIIYAISLFAWVIEIAGAILLWKIMTGVVDISILSDYLSAAIGIGESAGSQYFVLASIILLLCTYIIIRLFGREKE